MQAPESYRLILAERVWRTRKDLRSASKNFNSAGSDLSGARKPVNQRKRIILAVRPHRRCIFNQDVVAIKLHKCPIVIMAEMNV